MQVLKVRVQTLQADAFRPFGQILESQSPLYPDVDGGQISVMMLHLKRLKQRIDLMAFHGSYNQTMFPVKGAVIMILAPAPTDLHAAPDACEIDYDKIAAFLIEPGQAIQINRGVGHNSMPVGEECTLISVTKKHGKEIEPVVAFVEGRSGRLQTNEVIEYVNFGQRDGRVIELEL